jgi:hypothetical protein
MFAVNKFGSSNRFRINNLLVYAYAFETLWLRRSFGEGFTGNTRDRLVPVDVRRASAESDERKIRQQQSHTSSPRGAKLLKNKFGSRGLACALTDSDISSKLPRNLSLPDAMLMSAVHNVSRP